MNRAYKINPENYKRILGLSDDLAKFYQLYELHCMDKTQDSFYALRNQWEILFFTIKHREVEGFLSPMVADEIRGYLEELVNDRF